MTLEAAKAFECSEPSGLFWKVRRKPGSSAGEGLACDVSEGSKDNQDLSCAVLYKVYSSELGLRNQLWLRDQHHRGKIFWEGFPQGQHTEAVMGGGWQLNLVMCKSHPGGAGL